jgi:biotin-dependent carboxylase-like uncharacterized protein
MSKQQAAMSLQQSGLVILQAHPLVQVQDAGRRGYANVGVTEGGWLDATAARLANALVDNPANAAVLEIALGGFRAEALGECVIALTGANLPVTINGIAQSRYQRLQLITGDIIDIGYANRQGARCYLAVHGGLQTPEVLGSRATVLREQFSPFAGGPLSAGQVLPYLPSRAYGSLSLPYAWHYRHRRFRRLSLVLGAQAALLGPQLTKICAQIYQVGPAADRMGVRLQGRAVEMPALNLLSEGLCVGSVQVPPDGMPIVMLRDHQTMGGYPKIGAICGQSQAWLGQALPGDFCQFEVIDAATAITRARSYEAKLAVIEQQLREQAGAWRS